MRSNLTPAGVQNQNRRLAKILIGVLLLLVIMTVATVLLKN